MDHKKTGRHADTQSAAAILSSSTPPALDHNTISSTTSKRQSAAHPRMMTIRGTSDHHHLESVITIGWNDRSPSLECASRGWTDFTIPFLRRLGELGWVEDRNILVEFRWKDGSPEATRAFLTEFVRLKVDVIHALTNADALEAKRATSVIPIVAFAEEPLRAGLVTRACLHSS